MNNIKIKEACLIVDGRKHLLISGEFHYWRHSPECWDAIFDRIHDMDINIVSTFVPFNYHEISRHNLDFEGRTSQHRDLPAWLKMAHRKGFYVILRPSPNEAGEWPNAGLPERLLKYHRLHPEYISEVKFYYDTLLPVIIPFLATRNGPIVMMQADNEPHGDLCGKYDQIVPHDGNGLFAEWLRSEYGGIDELNTAWNARYTDFAEVCPFYEETIVNRAEPSLRRLLPSGGLEVRFIDTQRFAKWYSAEIVSWTAGYFRQAGVDIPLSANIWHPAALDFVRVRDKVECTGIDIYIPENFRGVSMTQDSSQAFKVVFESLKLATAQLGYAYIAEFGAGRPSFWANMGIPKGTHPAFTALTCMAYGMKGFAYYMIVNRDNWTMAPINEWGFPTPLFDTYREIIAIARKLDPSSNQNCCEISLLADKAHRITDDGNYKDVFSTLFENDLDFELFDPGAARQPRTKCLIYGGSERLARKHQETLLDFVRQGGKVIFFSRMPVEDDTGRPCNLLDLPLPAAIRPVATPLDISCGRHMAHLSKRGHCGYRIHVFHYDVGAIADGEPIKARQISNVLAIPGGDGVYNTQETVQKDERTKAVIGFTRKIGKGEIAVAGVNPSPSLLNLLLTHMDIPWYTRCYEPGILTTLHRKIRGRGLRTWYLFVRNDNPGTAYAAVQIQIDALGISKSQVCRILDIRKGTSESIKGSALESLTVRLAGFDVNIYEIQSGKPVQRKPGVKHQTGDNRPE
ncbi:MAG: beta-galactosidase [Lentisphaerota bacterium]